MYHFPQLNESGMITVITIDFAKTNMMDHEHMMHNHDLVTTLIEHLQIQNLPKCQEKTQQRLPVFSHLHKHLSYPRRSPSVVIDRLHRVRVTAIDGVVYYSPTMTQHCPIDVCDGNRQVTTVEFVVVAWKSWLIDFLIDWRTWMLQAAFVFTMKSIINCCLFG